MFSPANLREPYHGAPPLEMGLTLSPAQSLMRQ